MKHTTQGEAMRTTILNLEASKIREVANAGLGRDDVLAFWFGEGNEVTPDFVRQAAMDSLQLGETFYAHNLGLPELRQGIADHMSQKHPGLHGQGVSADRVAVTAGGVNALMLAVQALVDAGDEVLAITPVWPNLVAQPRIMGAHLRTLSLHAVDGRWQLDLDASKFKIVVRMVPPWMVRFICQRLVPQVCSCDKGWATRPVGLTRF